MREVLTSSRTANAFCTPRAGASASDMHWLGYCASLMLSFLPTRTARSTNLKEKDSDVVTDGTVGWRRRNGKGAALASREFALVGHHHHCHHVRSCFCRHHPTTDPRCAWTGAGCTLLPASAAAYWMTALRYPQVPGSPTFTLAWTIFLESRVPDPCWAVRSHLKERSFLSIRPRTRSAS